MSGKFDVLKPFEGNMQKWIIQLMIYSRNKDPNYGQMQTAIWGWSGVRVSFVESTDRMLKDVITLHYEGYQIETGIYAYSDVPPLMAALIAHVTQDDAYFDAFADTAMARIALQKAEKCFDAGVPMMLNCYKVVGGQLDLTGKDREQIKVDFKAHVASLVTKVEAEAAA